MVWPGNVWIWVVSGHSSDLSGDGRYRRRRSESCQLASGPKGDLQARLNGRTGRHPQFLASHADRIGNRRVSQADRFRRSHLFIAALRMIPTSVANVCVSRRATQFSNSKRENVRSDLSGQIRPNIVSAILSDVVSKLTTKVLEPIPISVKIIFVGIFSNQK